MSINRGIDKEDGIHTYYAILLSHEFPWWLSSKKKKQPTYNVGDTEVSGSIPESGRSPGRGHGNRLQYFCLESPMDRGAWRATVHVITKSWTWLVWLSMHACCCCCCWVASVVSDSVQPHRQQPTRLPCPWDSPGKNTGVGCRFLLQSMKGKSESEVAQSSPTLSDPTDCSLPGSSIHGIFQARVLEWGAIAFSDRGVNTQVN